MGNSSEVVSFVFSMYASFGRQRYLLFSLALLLYVSVIIANVALVAVVYVDRNLHEPMYLLLCSLFLNEIYGSTSVLPCFMTHLLSQSNHIPVSLCFLQIFAIHTYVAVEFGTLTVMAYDRYVCICKPLHYNTVMTRRRVQTLILVIWVASFVEVGVLLSFTRRLRFCGTVINKVFCAHHLVVALSCSPDRTVSLVHDLVFGLLFTVTAPVCFITFTYVKILSECRRASGDARRKALDTCVPHLVSLASFIFACFYSLITQRFRSVPYPLCVVLSMYATTVQPLQNPLMYGLRLSKIRQAWRSLMAGRRCHRRHRHRHRPSLKPPTVPT